MFRASTILRELVQNLDKVTLLLKHSVKLIRCILCDVAACREMACVLFVVLYFLDAPRINTNMLISPLKYVRHCTASTCCLC